MVGDHGKEVRGGRYWIGPTRQEQHGRLRPAGSAAVPATTEQVERVAFQREARLFGNGGKRGVGQAGRNLHDAMALDAGDVMVVLLAAHPVAVRTISKRDPIQDALLP